MPRHVVFRPEADVELLETQAWYAGRQPELGARFGADIASLMLRVAEKPKMFPKVRGATRRAILSGFPYAVYFRELGDTIVVLAVHGRQDPKRWQSRR